MTREVPPLPLEMRAFLDRERDLPELPATVHARAMARARAAVLAEHAVPAHRPVARATAGRLRWLVAAALTGLASVAVSATAYRLSQRWSHEPDSSGRLASTERGAARPGTASAAGVLPAGPAVAVVEEPAPAKVPPLQPSRAGAAVSQDELRLLRRARVAVAREDFEAALSVIGDHFRRFPDGRLAEEREALRVKALSELGRTDEARRAANAFRRRFPESILLSAIGQLPSGRSPTTGTTRAGE